MVDPSIKGLPTPHPSGAKVRGVYEVIVDVEPLGFFMSFLLHILVKILSGSKPN